MGYIDRKILWFLSAPSGKGYNNNINQATAASFHFVTTSLVLQCSWSPCCAVPTYMFPDLPLLDAQLPARDKKYEPKTKRSNAVK